MYIQFQLSTYRYPYSKPLFIMPCPHYDQTFRDAFAGVENAVKEKLKVSPRLLTKLQSSFHSFYTLLSADSDV